MTTPSRPDLVVIGAGVAGLGVAWRAAQRGMQVTVLERAQHGQADGAASRVAAGMLAPVSEADPGEPELLRLGLAAAAAWPAFAQELRAMAGIDVGFREAGTLLVAHNADEARALEREHALREGLGVPVARLRPSEARRLEPGLAPTVRLALHAPGDHSVDPRALLAALRTAALEAGVAVRQGACAAVHVDAGRATGAIVDGERLAAGQVVVAAGAWSGAVPGIPEPARVDVRPVKGQILRLRDPDGPGLLHRVLRYEGGYLVPRDDGRYVLGATMEERGFDATVTAGGVYELLRDAVEIVPGVSELLVEEVGVGFRPGSRDNLPVLGPSPHVDGLHFATGQHRNGILLAPLAGDRVADALEAVPA